MTLGQDRLGVGEEGRKRNFFFCPLSLSSVAPFHVVAALVFSSSPSTFFLHCPRSNTRNFFLPFPPSPPPPPHEAHTHVHISKKIATFNSAAWNFFESWCESFTSLHVKINHYSGWFFPPPSVSHYLVGCLWGGSQFTWLLFSTLVQKSQRQKRKRKEGERESLCGLLFFSSSFPPLWRGGWMPDRHSALPSSSSSSSSLLLHSRFRIFIHH